MIVIDCVVKDALQAYETYAAVFETKLKDSSKNLPKSAFNEVIFELEQMQFHLFDANPKMGWQIADPKVSQPLWFNLVVRDAQALYQRAVKAGFEVIVPLTEDKELGVLNGVVRDPFHYSWVIEQNLRTIDFKTRHQILNNRLQ